MIAGLPVGGKCFYIIHGFGETKPRQGLSFLVSPLEEKRTHPLFLKERIGRIVRFFSHAPREHTAQGIDIVGFLGYIVKRDRSCQQ